MPGIASYAVQRSSNAINFNAIASVAANNASAINYYQDPAPLSGDNYYRLRTTGNDGAVAYSNIITDAKNAINIFPNPAVNSLHIEGLSSNQKTKLTILDFTGNIAISQQLSANSSACNLNIARLRAGNYLLKIETTDDVITKKFVKK